MKATLYDLKGDKKGEVEVPAIFGERIREDIAIKYFEASKYRQPYSPGYESGRRHSAAGTISHKRHDWKGHYGQGRSRAPRKTMMRRGTQFFWIGAETSAARGGRSVHTPKLNSFQDKKINKKEARIAMISGFAATANESYISKRYSSLDKFSIKLPVVIENVEKARSKELLAMLNKIFGSAYSLVLRNKEVRAGRGKTRGRKYKSNAGLLFIKGSNENLKAKGIEVKNVGDVSILDLYPLGRLTVYTKQALHELSKSNGEK